MRRTTAPTDLPSRTWLELGEAQRLLIDQYPRLAFGLDLKGRLRWVNPAGAQQLGYAAGDLVGRPLIGTLLRQDEVDARAAALSEELGRRIAADHGVFSARLRRGLADVAPWVLRRQDGEPLALHLSLGTLRDGQGVVTGLIAVAVDGEPAADAPIAMSHHDALTGLPSRAVLQDRAEMAIQRAARAGSKIGILALGLDGFDALCARHGASVGDDLLRATAARLHFELRKTDSAVRMAGGQFVAMLVDLRDGAEAELVAGKIAQALSAPVNTGVEVLQPRCRVGVAVYPTHGDQLLPLLEAADRALQAAQQAGQAVAVAPAA